MKKISLLALSLVGALTLQAQDYLDALRFSESFVEGNARYMAMGGALSSLGGNVGAMSINPASSAVFKKSVVEFSPTYIYSKSENYYRGYDKAFESQLKVPSFGLVGYKPLKQNDVFVSGLSFSFSMNAQNRYNETLKYTKQDPTSSLTDDFLRLASNEIWYDDYNTLAWNTSLLNYDTVSNSYYSDFVKDGSANYDGLFQDIKIERNGQQREYLFNIGVDFSEYVFFGADLCFENIAYSETKIIAESDVDNVRPELSDFSYSETNDVTGSGVGGKFGIIIRPIEYLRIGGAIHTPMTYNFSTDYENILEAFYDINIGESNRAVDTYSGEYDYKLSKPAKFVASLGFVYKNLVNIGVDLESMDYSQCSFDAEYQSLSDRNSQIGAELKKVNNIKCGGEFRYGPFMFRAGYAMYGNPYKNVSGDNFYRSDYSAGVGLATNLVYCDLSWMRAKSKQNNLLYNDLKGNLVDANSTVKNDYITFTIGFKL